MKNDDSNPNASFNYKDRERCLLNDYSLINNVRYKATVKKGEQTG